MQLCGVGFKNEKELDVITFSRGVECGVVFTGLETN